MDEAETHPETRTQDREAVNNHDVQSCVLIRIYGCVMRCRAIPPQAFQGRRLMAMIMVNRRLYNHGRAAPDLAEPLEDVHIPGP